MRSEVAPVGPQGDTQAIEDGRREPRRPHAGAAVEVWR